MYTHNWWHLSLFYLDRNASEDFLMELYDKHIWGICKESAQDQVNAVSFLWRLNLRNLPMISRWEDISDYISPHIREHIQPFIDLHYIYSLARSGNKERLDEMIESLREAKYQRKQHEIAIPAATAIIAHAQGNFEETYQCLHPIIERLKEAGGSNAQRDVFDQTYIHTLIQTKRYAEALPWVENRVNKRPRTPAIFRDLVKIYNGLDDQQKAEEAQNQVDKLENLYGTDPVSSKHLC